MRLMGPTGIPAIRTRAAETAGLTSGLAVAQGVDDGGAKAITVAGTRAIGVVGDVPAIGVAVGDAMPVVEAGECVAISGDAISAGEYVKSDNAGKLVPVTAGAGTSEEVVGRAVSSTTATGQEFILRVTPFVLTTPAAA